MSATILVECTACSKVFTSANITSEESNIAMVDPKTKQDVILKLSYYRCPYCQHVFPFLLNDAITLAHHQRMDEVNANLARSAKANRIPQTKFLAKLSGELTLKSKRLHNALKERFNGEPYQMNGETRILDLPKSPENSGKEQVP